MPKLTLVKNPLVSEDKVTFISKDTKFIPFIKKFLSVNPAYRSLLDSSSFILRVNNIKIDDPLRALNLKLSNSDELVLYPNIQQAGFWAAVWNGIQAGAEIATTVGAEVAPAAGAGGTLSVPGTLGVYIGYGAIILGEFALIAGASYGINALFAPSMSSPSGPTEDSPTYGWNITPTAREGIPISVVYGEHMVGGNSIITAKEYTIYSPYRWMDAAEESRRIQVTKDIPFCNLFAVGMRKPCRGVRFDCREMRTPFLFFSYRFWTKAGQAYFWEEFFDYIEDEKEGLAKTIASTSDYNRLTKTVSTAITKKIQSKAQDFNDKLGRIINDPNQSLNETDVRAIIYELFADAQEINYKREDFVYNADNQNNAEIIEDGLYYASKKAQQELTDIVWNWHDPTTSGKFYSEVFYSNPYADENLGSYIVGCVYINEKGMHYDISVDGEDETTQEIKAKKMSDYAVTLAKAYEPRYQSEEDRIRIIDGNKHQPDTRYEQNLHQILGLSEGPCAGIKEIFVNGSPSDTVPEFGAEFFRGDKVQKLDVGDSDASTYDDYNHASIFHGRSEELKTFGSYSEFTTTENFDVDNVLIEVQSSIYMVSSGGHVRPIQQKDQNFKFGIQIGFEGISDFGYLLATDTYPSQGVLEEGRFLYFENELNGQFSANPVVSVWPCLPTRDFLFEDATLDQMEAMALRFEGQLLGLCAWLGIKPEGISYSHSQYKRSSNYRELVLNSIRESMIDYFLVQKVRMKVRVTRLVGAYDSYDFNRSGAFDFTVKGYQEVTYTGQDYIDTALLAINAKATSESSASVPEIKSVLKGKLVLVPKLFANITGDSEERVYHEFAWYDEDVKSYRSYLHNGKKCRYARNANTNQIEWVEEWSSNPVWCLYDLLLNRRYGLGNYTAQYNVPVDWFIEAAEYCDTLVPDGTVRYAEDTIKTTLTDTDSDFFRRGNPYYDENLDGLDKAGQGVFGQHLADSLNRFNEIEFDEVMTGSSIFARKEDGTWTRAVVETIVRNIPSLVTEDSQADLTFSAKAYPTAEESSYWTNGLPCSNHSSDYWKQYEMSEKRHRLDLVIDNTSSAIDWLKTICDTFRAFPIWIGGGYRPIVDKPQDPVTTIGMGNILKGSLSISYTPISKSYNLLEGQFINRENQFSRDIRQVVDADVDVATATDVLNTIRKKTVKMFGVTRPTQLVRDLAYGLLNYKLNKKIITFSMGIEHLGMIAGDVFTFSHYLLIGDKKSGRLLGYGTDGGEHVIIDTDVSALTEPLQLVVRLTIGKGFCDKCQKYILNEDGTLDITATECSCGYPIDGEEIAQEYVVSSVDGQKIYYTPFGNIKPKAYDPYEIGESTEVTNKYRVMSIVPNEARQASIMAIEYTDSVFGQIRQLVNGGRAGYDEPKLAAQSDRVKPLNSLPVALPPKDVLVYPYDLEKGQIKVTFWKPDNLSSSLTYLGGEIKILSVDGAEEESRRIYLGFKGALFTLPSKTETYTIEVRAVYMFNKVSEVVVSEFNFSTLKEEDLLVDPRPANVTGLRLSYKCRPWEEKFNSNYNYFATDYIHLLWDRIARCMDDDPNPFNKNMNIIAGYKLKIELLDNFGNWYLSKDLELGASDNEKRLEFHDLLQDTGDVSLAVALSKINGLRATVIAYTELGFESKLPAVEEFYPYTPFSPKGVKVFEFLGSVFINWEHQDDWENVKEFHVSLRVTRTGSLIDPNGAEWTTPEPVVTTKTHCCINIPPDVRTTFTPLGFLWGCRFEPTIKTITKVGGSYSTRVLPATTVDPNHSSPNDWDEDIPSATESQKTIPDYMLENPATNIIVYDLVYRFHGFFGIIPTVAYQRDNNFSSFEDRQKLIDGYLGTGITYTGLDWGSTKNVVRITYQSPTEEEFSRTTFNVDQACRIWIEYLNQDENGDYINGDWEYLGGDASHELDADDKMTEYATSTLAEDKYWEVSSGTNEATFPLPLKNKYIRLIVSPIGADTVTVNEVRFIRVGTFEELEVNLIKNQGWDSGDHKFYLDANAQGLISGEPVLWSADAGIGGTRDNPLIKLTPEGMNVISTEAITVQSSGEVGTSGETWPLLPEFYLGKWATTVPFFSDDRDNISWGTGEFKFSDGTIFNIDSGSDTIDADGSSYVYFDANEITTQFYATNDFTDLVLLGRVSIARGLYNTDSEQVATIIGDSTLMPTITETVLGENCISTQQLQANSVTAGEIQVNYLSAIVSDVGTLIAGLIKSESEDVWFNLDSGEIYTNKEGGFRIGGSGGMILEEGGDITFENCSTLNAETSFLQIYPYDSGEQALLIGRGNTPAKPWRKVLIDTVECSFYLDDDGDGLDLNSIYDIDITSYLGKIDLECSTEFGIVSLYNEVRIEAAKETYDFIDPDVALAHAGGDIVLIPGAGSGEKLYMYLPTSQGGSTKEMVEVWFSDLTNTIKAEKI